MSLRNARGWLWHRYGWEYPTKTTFRGLCQRYFCSCESLNGKSHAVAETNTGLPAKLFTSYWKVLSYHQLMQPVPDSLLGWKPFHGVEWAGKVHRTWLSSPSKGGRLLEVFEWWQQETVAIASLEVHRSGSHCGAWFGGCAGRGSSCCTYSIQTPGGLSSSAGRMTTWSFFTWGIAGAKMHKVHVAKTPVDRKEWGKSGVLRVCITGSRGGVLWLERTRSVAACTQLYNPQGFFSQVGFTIVWDPSAMAELADDEASNGVLQKIATYFDSVWG